MRRSEKEITDRAEIDAVIRRCRVCRLGLSDDGEPYIVPLCFGYDGTALYFHCAPGGRKVDILRKNNRVCVEFDLFEGMVEADEGCRWSVRYRSVLGFGTARPVEDPAEKQRALALLLAQYSPRAYAFPPEAVRHTAVYRVDLARVTGKQTPRTE